MKKYTLLCLFVIGLTASLQAQSLSFDEALSQMRSGNQKLKGIENKMKPPIITASRSAGYTCPN